MGAFANLALLHLGVPQALGRRVHCGDVRTSQPKVHSTCSLCMTLRIYSQLREIGCGAFSFCVLFSGAGDAIALC